MDTRTRTRIGLAVVAGLGALVLAGLALATVYGFAEEYGGGSFADLAFLVVPIPVLAVGVTVTAWPRLRTRTQLVAVAGAVAVMVGGGLAADALGQVAHRERLVEESRTFACNGPNSEITLPAAIDETWRELPREAPIYGPVQGGRTDCTAAVSGDAERAFTAYTGTFRQLDGWSVEVDRPTRFVMVRDDVRVTVRRIGSPDHLTTIEVGVTG
jgi:hypothetical protein